MHRSPVERPCTYCCLFRSGRSTHWLVRLYFRVRHLLLCPPRGQQQRHTVYRSLPLSRSGRFWRTSSVSGTYASPSVFAVMVVPTIYESITPWVSIPKHFAGGLVKMVAIPAKLFRMSDWGLRHGLQTPASLVRRRMKNTDETVSDTRFGLNRTGALV